MRSITKSKLTCWLLVIAMMMLLFPGTVLAEGEGDDPPLQFGTISGIVQSEGSSLSGVSINVSDVGSTTSAGDGSYSFTEVTPGTYTAEFSKSGYVDKSISKIIVNEGQNTVVNCQMSAEIVKYTVTFNRNGGTTNADPSSIQVSEGDSVGTLPSPPTRNSYTFDGWNTAANGSGSTFTATTSVTENLTVYAQWKAAVVSKPVTSITVAGSGGKTSVVKGQTLQMTATVLPADAADKTVTWSVSDGTGVAIIKSSGLLTGVTTGTVTVKATANDGSGVSGTKTIKVVTGGTPVTGLKITGEDNKSSVEEGESLQMSVTVTPSNATDKSVIWSVDNGTGSAIISSKGLLRGISEGTVTVKAEAKDGSGVTATKKITVIEAGEGTLLTSGGVTIKESNAVFTIPSGAVRTDARVTLERYNGRKSTLPADSMFVGYVYELTKDKSGDFLKPMTVTLPYSSSSVDTDDYDLSIYWYNTRYSEWEELDKVEIKRSAISGETKKLGEFAIIATEKVKPVVPVKPVLPALNDISRHWAKADIEKLVEMGAISGYADKSFRPENTITRAEFATIIVKAYGLTGTGKTFSDTSGHWAKSYISTAYAAGIINGYSDWSFGPDDKITREQMAVMIIQAERLGNAKGTLNFSDSSAISTWARQAVGAAGQYKLITGYPDNTFRPKNNATRAEAASIIIRAIND